MAHSKTLHGFNPKDFIVNPEQMRL